ncbi:MAG: signal peptidase II [Acidobacteriia bacterium]|nr:signal peptidase II [Terriglobia bacterium]
MRFLYLLVSLLVFLLDRWSKMRVVEQISLGESIPIVRNFIHLTHSQNPGIAFGMFGLNPSPLQSWILIGLSLVAIGVVATLAWRYPAEKAGLQIAFALILGGAAGNLWDRIFDGKVTDFIDVFIRDHHWPVFNVADSAITVGVVGLAIALFFFDKRESGEKPRGLEKQVHHP